MSYEVIARRYRPKVFDEVVGQRHVTETLKNALAQDRMPHALLFAGPRGVGKTTTARIVAKALNCAKGPTPTPCGACPACEQIAQGRSMDCLEVDAASNTQVEKTRDLLETVQYAPTGGRFKIYIIDEAHMLSTSSFNALLKTLEEPPPRVVFILATTEPHRILPTIHSRCQRHDFRLLGAVEIADHLRAIVTAEKVTAEPDALALIAQAACGSLRDAESLLDQAIGCLGERLESAAVGDLLGLVRADVLAEAAAAVIAKDAARALRLVDTLARHGQDLRQFAQELGGHLRDLAVLKVCPEPGTLLENARVPLAVSQEQASAVTVAELELMLQTLRHAEADMRRAAQPRLVLELALIRLTEIHRLPALQDILDQVTALEARLGGAPRAPLPAPAALPLLDRQPARMPSVREAAPAPLKPAPVSTDEPDEPAPTAPAADVATTWAAVVSKLRNRKRLASVLEEIRPGGLEGERFVLEVPNGNHYVKDTLEDRETHQVLAEQASAAFGRRVRIEYRYVKAAPRPAAPPDPIPPVNPEDQALIQHALELFGGKVVDGQG